MPRKDQLKVLYEKNLKETKKKIKASVKKDNLIIQSINCLTELSRNSNVISKRLREWYALYAPEVVEKYHDSEHFVNLITKKSKKELLGEIGVRLEDSMGADLDKDDVDYILGLAELLKKMYKSIDEQKEYLEKTMAKVCPNMYELAGSLVGAQLIEHAGSLKNLASTTSSKIQLLGAEKALFRHLRTGAKSPKHGLLIQHPYVAGAKNKGKAARHFADKISIAVKVDYFKGDYIADKLKKQLVDN